MVSHGEVRLAVAYGAVSTTVLARVGAEGWSPLPVDGQPALSSAVLVGADGAVTAGPRAWVQPPAGSEFVVAPLRLGRGQATVAGRQVEVADLVTATLAAVARQSTLDGTTVGEVRVAVPAGWGPRQRMWLRQAAHRAGLGHPALVDAPVAAARYLAATGLIRGLVGDLILVCDLGAGCEASVLRRTVDGYEVLSTMSDPGAGGHAVDDLLLARVAAATPVSAGSGPGGSGSAAAGGGDEVVIRAAVRAAKEALAAVPAVTVAVPPPGAPVVLTRPVLAEVSRPVWDRCARLASAAVAATDLTPDQLAEVVCVGGSAAEPAAVQAVAAALGRTPVVPDDPARAIAWGTADAAAVPDRPAPAGTDWASVKPYMRKTAGMLVAAVLSLAVLGVALAGVDQREAWWEPFRGQLYPSSFIYVSWGLLAVAGALAVISALGGSVVLAGFLAEEKGRPLDGPLFGSALLAGAVFGAGVAALYGVIAAFYLAQFSVGSGLRWALLPQLPTVGLIVLLAVSAARTSRVPRQGWHQLLRVPASSAVLITAGVALTELSLTVRAVGLLGLLMSAAGVVGGLLVGVAVACTVVGRPLFRAIVAVPLGLFCAILPAASAGGVTGVMYALATAVWVGARVWDLHRSPLRVTHRGP